jgi:hypothetical protein
MSLHHPRPVTLIQLSNCGKWKQLGWRRCDQAVFQPVVDSEADKQAARVAAELVEGVALAQLTQWRPPRFDRDSLSTDSGLTAAVRDFDPT